MLNQSPMNIILRRNYLNIVTTQIHRKCQHEIKTIRRTEATKECERRLELFITFHFYVDKIRIKCQHEIKTRRRTETTKECERRLELFITFHFLVDNLCGFRNI